MGVTLLVTDARFSWRSFVTERASDWISLDVSLPESGPAGRVTAWSGGKLKAWRFVGTTDPSLNPLSVLTAVPALAASVGGHPWVVSPPFPPTPFGRHMGLCLAELVRPVRVLTPAGSALHEWPWPVGAEEIELPHELPPLVREAQRRAQWMALIERSTEHTFRLGDVAVTGARLGSGRRLGSAEGWAEATGHTLLVISSRSIDDGEVSGLMDSGHSHKLCFNRPEDYAGLLCSLARQDGEDFAMGFLKTFDADSGTLRVSTEAVEGAAPKIIKLGLTKLDASGRELGAPRPWSL
jgi:hypothetical protein